MTPTHAVWLAAWLYGWLNVCWTDLLAVVVVCGGKKRHVNGHSYPCYKIHKINKKIRQLWADSMFSKESMSKCEYGRERKKIPPLNQFKWKTTSKQLFARATNKSLPKYRWVVLTCLHLMISDHSLESSNVLKRTLLGTQ